MWGWIVVYLWYAARLLMQEKMGKKKVGTLQMVNVTAAQAQNRDISTPNWLSSSSGWGSYIFAPPHSVGHYALMAVICLSRTWP